MDTQEAQDTIQASLKGVQSRLICHVPDFVWAAKEPVQETPEAIMTNGVLLFADVSGFTALTGVVYDSYTIYKYRKHIAEVRLNRNV
jgi:hypothetical protein